MKETGTSYGFVEVENINYLINHKNYSSNSFQFDVLKEAHHDLINHHKIHIN